MKKRIFYKNWIGFMPYKIASDVDTYYIHLANNIEDVIAKSDFVLELGFKGEEVKDLAVLLTVWFMDVVSEGSIWMAFTSECKRRYGRYLPFYHYDEREYFPDEVNEEDVSFLLWHFTNTIFHDDRFYDPDSYSIINLATKLFDVFEGEFEQAPINSEWREALQPENLDDSDFYGVRSYLQLVMECNYLDRNTYEDLLRKSQEVATEPDYAKYRYENYISVIYEPYSTNLLGLCPAQWAARLLLQTERTAGERLSTIRTLPLSYYLVTGVDDEYLYLEDIIYWNEEVKTTLKVLRSSFSNISAEMTNIGESVLVCRLTLFDDEWHLNGVCIGLSKKDVEKDKATINKYKSQSPNNLARVHKIFLDSNRGKEFLFCENRQQALSFTKQLLGKLYKPSCLPEHIGKNSVICCVEGQEVSMLPDIALYTKSDGNPCYNSAEAKKHGLLSIIDLGQSNYGNACRMYDLGMFEEFSAYNIDKYYEEGRTLAQENMQFLLDYFLHGCRKTV